MTLSIISQDGTTFNYSNAVSCVTCGEYDDGSGYGFMVYLIRRYGKRYRDCRI